MVNAEALRENRLPDPVPLTVRDMLDFATLQGATTANLDHVTGALTPGKEADMIMPDTNSLNMFPINNPIGVVVEAAHVGNIDSVWVRGRAVKRHGKRVDVDIQALRRRMEATVDGRSGSTGRAGQCRGIPVARKRVQLLFSQPPAQPRGQRRSQGRHTDRHPGRRTFCGNMNGKGRLPTRP